MKSYGYIRPILRGRDIKRYSYDWAELWLIATFPSRHYDIEQYPAVKEYLLSFGIERLEQTGKTYVINGETVKAAVWLAERSLRREDGRTADTAGMGGWDLKVRTAAVESTVG